MAASWLWLATIFAFLTLAASIEDKCAACHAVAKELDHGLANEKPRNHLDLRNRLDSKGQRRGKVIDYRVSELRVVELLDGLCEKMQDYTLQKTDSNRQEWIKVNNWENLTASMGRGRSAGRTVAGNLQKEADSDDDDDDDDVEEEL
ncbi:hypothetical protein SOVF_154820 [Spinacia oleracea]|nr:hypothetical protein SOVF_154820 [Spinacia oleracea]